MTYPTFKLNIISERDGKKYYNDIGVAFINTDENGNIVAINIKDVTRPHLEIAAFPKRDKDEN